MIHKKSKKSDIPKIMKLTKLGNVRLVPNPEYKSKKVSSKP